jgi:hypothetical protein
LLQGDPARWPEDERAALSFARKLIRFSYQVTDEEVAELIKKYGDRNVVAMVLLLAHATFQDRLLLSLGLSQESTGPSDPLAVQLDQKLAESASHRAPPRQAPAAAAEAPPEARRVWEPGEFPQLQRSMLRQKERTGRIRVPSWEEVAANIQGPKPTRPLRIRWSLVCTGYQPELATRWSACTRNFARDSKQDRVFEESLFWVVTRSLQCFY